MASARHSGASPSTSPAWSWGCSSPWCTGALTATCPTPSRAFRSASACCSLSQLSCRCSPSEPYLSLHKMTRYYYSAPQPLMTVMVLAKTVAIRVVGAPMTNKGIVRLRLINTNHISVGLPQLMLSHAKERPLFSIGMYCNALMHIVFVTVCTV